MEDTWPATQRNIWNWKDSPGHKQLRSKKMLQKSSGGYQKRLLPLNGENFSLSANISINKFLFQVFVHVSYFCNLSKIKGVESIA